MKIIILNKLTSRQIKVFASLLSWIQATGTGEEAETQRGHVIQTPEVDSLSANKRRDYVEDVCYWLF